MGGARTGRGVARDAQGSRRSRTSGHGRMRPRLAAGATCDCEWPHATRVARVCRRVARAWRMAREWLASGAWVAAAPLAPSATARARPQAWRRRAGTSPAPAPSRAQARAGVAGPVFQGAGTHYADRARIKDSSGAVRGPRRRTGRPDIAGPIRVTQQTCIAASLSDVHRRSSGPARVHRVLGRPGASSCRRARL